MPSASPATPTISQPARIAAEAMPEHLPGVAETTTPVFRREVGVTPSAYRDAPRGA